MQTPTRTHNVPHAACRRAAQLAARADASCTALDVQTRAGRVTVTVCRKRVKRLNLRVKPDGSVWLSAPARASMQAIQNFLDEKSDWIGTHVMRSQQRREQARREREESTRLVPLWGKLVPPPHLEQSPTLPGRATPLVHLRCAREQTPHAPHSAIGAGLDERVLALYRREMERELPAMVERVETRMGIRANSWQIRHMKTRWGSCTPTHKSIRINSALAAYPPCCLEYVVVHELCHILEASHNARFHRLVDRFCPDNRVAISMLKRSARDVATGAWQ